MTSKIKNIKTTLQQYKNEILLEFDQDIDDCHQDDEYFDPDTIKKDYIRMYLTSNPDDEVKDITSNDSDKPEDFFQNLIKDKICGKK